MARYTRSAKLQMLGRRLRFLKFGPIDFVNSAPSMVIGSESR